MNKTTQNPDGEVELTSKMDGMGLVYFLMPWQKQQRA